VRLFGRAPGRFKEPKRHVLLSNGIVYTVDKADFSTCRKNGRQPVSCVFPD
jgi:hypothetical protein